MQLKTIIKDGIKTIRTGAFYNCSSLSKITISNTVTTNIICAFKNCTSLQSIQLPSNLQSIEWHAFLSCWSLEVICIPPTVTWMEKEDFQNCKSLRIINIPDRVQHIGYGVVDCSDHLVTNETRDCNNQWIWNCYNLFTTSAGIHLSQLIISNSIFNSIIIMKSYNKWHATFYTTPSPCCQSICKRWYDYNIPTTCSWCCYYARWYW